MLYTISDCPLPFHDLLEIYDFLSNLSFLYLYMYDGLYILLNDIPIQQIHIYYFDGSYCITPRDLRTFRR